MTRLIAAATVACASFAIVSFASAHHGTSLYVDVSKSISVAGTFSELKFTNPHVEVKFYAPNDKGEMVLWSGETHSPASLTRLGWRADTFRPRERITVVGNPSRDGSPYMQLTEIIFASDNYHLSPAVMNPPRAPTPAAP